MVTVSKQHIRRTVPLRVKISPEVAARLDAIARPRGLTSATMGAFAVGEFVERFERGQAWGGEADEFVLRGQSVEELQG